MGLLSPTLTPAWRRFRVYAQGTTGLRVGQQIKVRGDVPKAHWLRSVAEEMETPFDDTVDLDTVFAVDIEAEKRDLAAAAEAERPPAPPRMLTKEQRWKKLPWTREADLFEIAVREQGFPRPLELTKEWFPIRTGQYCWNEQFIDRWLEQKRRDRDQLNIFLGEAAKG